MEICVGDDSRQTSTQTQNFDTNAAVCLTDSVTKDDTQPSSCKSISYKNMNKLQRYEQVTNI